MAHAHADEAHPHGTTRRYKRGCRCADCREARRVYVASWRASLAPLAPDDPRHGSVNAYTHHGCRCGPCKLASARAYHAWYVAQCLSQTGGDAA